MNYIYGVCSFIIIYLLYELLIVRRNREKIYNSTEVIILKKVFKVDISKINPSMLGRIIGLVNAFIVSVTATVILIVSDSFFLQMLFGFGMLLLLICIIYPIVGICLRKKYGRLV